MDRRGLSKIFWLSLYFILKTNVFTFAFIAPSKSIRQLRKIYSTEKYTDSILQSRTEQDRHIEEWYRKQGILGTSQIKLCTTDKSVGGRGLFYNNKESARQGDVIAYIPYSKVINIFNLEKQFPDLKEIHQGDLSWQAKLTIYALRSMEEDNEKTNFQPWIKSWYGGGPCGPKPFQKYSREEIQGLMELTNASEDIVKETIDARYETYQKDWERVQEYYFKENEQKFADMYSIILSRTAALGPMWNNTRGVIPLHDMCNMQPTCQDPNIELFSFGDVRRMIGFVHTQNMIQVLARTERKKDNQAPLVLEIDERDILLVASKNLKDGDELWLSYKNCDENMEIRQRLWLLLQYGFPLHS